MSNRGATRVRGSGAQPTDASGTYGDCRALTVRGFDGEQILSGEKGMIWRNELAWNVLSRGHELYLRWTMAA